MSIIQHNKMDKFLVSARKYRPITFESVIGQEHITSTLKTAIKNNKLAQAFLFCGPRGVGKTTSARILAKTINCEALTDSTEPCNSCEPCKSFENNQSLNIYELDAASNNSVDDIRSLIDQVRFAPQQGDFKIYIIDEVHMLSTAAFNAFLKTLEEPPSHAIFILATTEKHKILPTILSRCQIFDFRRIQIADIAKHLAYVAEKEGVKFDSDALYLIGQKADGAMRDALSTFDQLSNFTNNEVVYDKVVKSLNVLDYSYFFEIVDLSLENDIAKCLQTFDRILQLGFDGQDFIVGLAKHLRDLLVCQNPETLFLLEVGDQLKSQYSAQAEKCSSDFIRLGIEVCYECESHYRQSKNKRLTVELSLMKLSSIVGMNEKKKSKLSDIKIHPFIRIERSPLEAQPIIEQVEAQISTRPSKLSVQEISKTIIKPQISEVKIVANKITPINSQVTGNILNIENDNLSIKGLFETKTKIEGKDQVASKNLPKENFELDQLINVWNSYAEEIKNKGMINFHSVLSRTPSYSSESKIILVKLDNSALLDEFTLQKPNLIAHIREALNNYDIGIDYEIEEASLDGKLYTSKDKFEKLNTKNPYLTTFKQKLSLEIDY